MAQASSWVDVEAFSTSDIKSAIGRIAARTTQKDTYSIECGPRGRRSIEHSLAELDHRVQHRATMPGTSDHFASAPHPTARASPLRRSAPVRRWCALRTG